MIWGCSELTTPGASCATAMRGVFCMRWRGYLTILMYDEDVSELLEGKEGCRRVAMNDVAHLAGFSGLADGQTGVVDVDSGSATRQRQENGRRARVKLDLTGTALCCAAAAPPSLGCSAQSKSRARESETTQAAGGTISKPARLSQSSRRGEAGEVSNQAGRRATLSQPSLSSCSIQKGLSPIQTH